MTLDDYDAVLALMRGTPGVSVRAADSRESIERYLARNPGLSLVAESNGRIVGCLFAGHDGRRGSLNHVVVAPAYRRMGIGRRIVTCALDGLEAVAIIRSRNNRPIIFSTSWPNSRPTRRSAFDFSTC